MDFFLINLLFLMGGGWDNGYMRKDSNMGCMQLPKYLQPADLAAFSKWIGFGLTKWNQKNWVPFGITFSKRIAESEGFDPSGGDQWPWRIVMMMMPIATACNLHFFSRYFRALLNVGSFIVKLPWIAHLDCFDQNVIILYY